jgi:hypothetical protein
MKSILPYLQKEKSRRFAPAFCATIPQLLQGIWQTNLTEQTLGQVRLLDRPSQSLHRRRCILFHDNLHVLWLGKRLITQPCAEALYRRGSSHGRVSGSFGTGAPQGSGASRSRHNTSTAHCPRTETRYRSCRQLPRSLPSGFR